MYCFTQLWSSISEYFVLSNFNNLVSQDMASYAALVSLMNVLTRIQHPSCPVSLDKMQMQSLFDKASFLIEFLEHYCNDLEGLERRITDAAHAAEDIVESYVVYRIVARSARAANCILAKSSNNRAVDEILSRYRVVDGVLAVSPKDRVAHRILGRFSNNRIVGRILPRSVASSDEGYTIFCQKLETAIQEIDSITEYATQVREKKGEIQQLCSSSMRVGSSLLPTLTTKLVGFEDELIALMDQLTGDLSARKIIPVVGMGGIGKTTLAKTVYNHPCVVNHFHVRAWQTVSPDYSVRGLILGLLCGMTLGNNVVGTKKTDEELGEQLYKSLFGRKYLIIVDDIWSSLAWDEIRRFLPDNSNGSRILLTTRVLSVACCIGTSSPCELKFLDDDKSWDLLSSTVFGQEACPPEMRNCGMRIAESCKGLPLAIVVIGGLLKVSNKTLEHWEGVAKNVSSNISREDDGHCLKILSLSYHQLPIHLKPCFLYMAVFPEDHKISVSKLIMLWVADGFLKPTRDNSLEELALGYLNDLIGRNLILVEKRDPRGTLKYLAVHDLVRDLCIREAQKEMFVCVIKKSGMDHAENIESQQRLVVHGVDQHLDLAQGRLARSFFWHGWHSPAYISRLTLVRVFLSTAFKSSLAEIAQLYNSRVLIFSVRSYQQLSSFSFISLLWNLESLIVDGLPSGFHLPPEIWELRHLRNLVCSQEVILPDPPEAHAAFVLHDLQTLETIGNFRFRNNLLDKIPNIKKLKICYNTINFMRQSPCFCNVVQCHKLETLVCKFSSDWRCSNELKTLKLSPSLRKLTLSYSRLPWESMTIVGSLPNLEVLKLKKHACIGLEWNTIEGEYQRLKSLLIEDCDLLTWKVEYYSHFPCLKYLTLERMCMMEIPQVFGDSMTLESIRLIYCYESIVLSAKEILEEQQNQGNDDLKVEVIHSARTEDKMELQSLACDNFHVKFVN